MKLTTHTKFAIITVLTVMVWGITTISIASNSDMSSDEVRKNIAQKLDEFGRIQNAINTIKNMDTNDAWTGTTNFSTKEAAERAANLGNDINTIISDIEALQEKRKENSENYTIMLQQVKKVIIDIKTTKQTVTDSVTKINLYTQRMVELLATIEQTKKYINNTQSTLVQLLPALYVIQNDYTNNAGNIDDLKLLLWSDSMGETLSYDDMMQWLSVKMDTLLGELSEAQKQYTQSFKDIHETRKQLKALTLTYREKIRTLEEQRAYLMSFLQLYKDNKVKLDKKLANLFETRTQLNNRIALMVQDIMKNKNTPEFTQKPWYQDFLALNDTREQRANFLWWSMLPPKSIITHFGDQVLIGEEQEVANNIQIAAEQGQEIYAPADGYVYFAQDQDSIGINWMVIIHKNGFISTFTNVQKILVESQSVVRRGQIIGLIGWQPGTRWAWWFSNSANLNMTIFKDGVAIDPLQELDLSVFTSKADLPEKYSDKYDNDMNTRNKDIDMSIVKFIPGETIEERRATFLSANAKAPYDDITLFEQAVAETNIDIDMWICIWQAETSLGRYFASANNFGNVWNNDRGDRVDKDSPLAWVRAIYVTLNNQYLGGYHTIYELSGYGNKDWAIYASSEYNWQKNVSRCLSTIKWYIVPEDYPFRTYNTQ